MNVESVVQLPAKIGEGPIWDHRAHCLWWIDILEKKLYCFDPKTDENKEWTLDLMPGTVVVRQSGGLMLSVPNGFAAFDPDSGKLELVAEVEAGMEGNRFNDGKCDPAGRFWAGSMQMNEKSAGGALYSLETNGTVRRHFGDVTVSNGIVWTNDATRMYYIDSRQPQIFGFDYDKQTGEVSNRVSVFAVPDGLGVPDGMAIDANGKLWIGFWGGWCVGQVCPVEKKLIQKVDMPVANVTACAFGGESLDQLYITTATAGLDESDMRGQPFAGNLFVAYPGIHGVKSNMYAG